MARLIAVLAGVLALVLGIASPANATSSPDQGSATAYTYNDPHHSSDSPTAQTERGPPAALDRDTTHGAVDRWSRGASAWSGHTFSRAVTTYGDTARLVLVALGTSTAKEQAEADGRALTSLARSDVAAKTESRVLSTAGDVCKFNSFTGTTLVLMGDGTKKPIKDVELGDTVMATDPETGESGPRKVVDLIRHSGPHTMVAVRLADGATIDATAQHPFWVESRDAWVDAIDLKPGDIVVDASGDLIAVAGVGISEQDLTAYNLTVAGLHTYYAGEDAVLVHNSGCTNIADLPASAVRNLTEDSNYAFSRLSQNHGVTRVEFREQIHMIKRNENLPADFNLSFGPTGDVWNPRTGELIGSIVHGG